MRFLKQGLAQRRFGWDAQLFIEIRNGCCFHPFAPIEICKPHRNLGAVETTYGPARTTSHVECTTEERNAMGIPGGLVRISVGIEDLEDLIADLRQAFQFLAG